MSDNAKVGKRLRFSFKTMLCLYLVGILVIVLGTAIVWPKYKQRMTKEHNAKAAQLTYNNYYSRRIEITYKDLAKLKKLSYTTAIDLNEQLAVSNATMIHLKNLTNLTCLDLSITKISDVGMAHLKNLTNLTELGLSRTKISDAGLEHIKSATNLTKLDLGYTKISDAGLEHIKNFTKLTKLYLFKTKVTKSGIAKLKKALPNCTIYSGYGID